MKNRVLLLPSIVITIALAGCSPLTDARSDEGPRAPVPSPALTTFGAPTTEPSAPTIPPAGENDERVAPTEIDATAATDAKSMAAAFLLAYSQNTLTTDAWFAGIRGFLTPAVADAYQYSKPTSIPTFALTGAATIQDGATASSAVVDVPTSIGVYQVLLVRPTPTGPWLASRAVPPARSR